LKLTFSLERRRRSVDHCRHHQNHEQNQQRNASGLEYVIFGDGGAVERMQDAIRARSASTCSDERFDFAHPTPQDFHRRMKLFRVRI
jgi:hypothetical protein